MRRVKATVLGATLTLLGMTSWSGGAHADEASVTVGPIEDPR